jgi:superoxide dismutase, Fe-Mn family
MPHQLPALPWAEDALEPHISKETIQYHYGKHHRAYVDKLNKLTANTEFSDLTLLEIIQKSDGGIFNNAAQVWNHSFYWNCLTPDAEPEPDPQSSLTQALQKEWGDFPSFKQAFTEAAAGHFGSGWAWLVADNYKNLKIITTSNADTPLTQGLTPLLTCDVWEHAYYIDTRNARPKYIENYWKAVNWDFVAKNFA